MTLVAWSTIGTVLLVILIILIIIVAVLYIMGRRIQRQQAEQQPMLDALKTTMSILVLDKKVMSLNDAVKSGLPPQLKSQTPFYLRRTKVPVIKAKVGPKIISMLTDPEIFERIPVKKEVKVVASGLYIREIKSVRGGSLEPVTKKKGFFAGLRKKAKESLRPQTKGQGS